jgi:hypothetical protein
MKFLLATLLIALLAYIAGLFMPWWSIALVAFLIALFVRPSIRVAFLAGFTGIFLLWTIVALWIDIKNEHILSHKIAQLFPLGGSSVLLILVTALVGALVGGFAAMSGASLLPAKRISGSSKIF